MKRNNAIIYISSSDNFYHSISQNSTILLFRINLIRVKINAKTKISDLIKHNPKAIDAIAEINHHFRKLKNPILRNTLARRVKIEDAARIGGVKLDFFLKKLEMIGFEVEKNESNMMENKENHNKAAIESFLASGIIVDLDVRASIASGTDPFKIIMVAIDDLAEGNILRIINTFEPIPLINVLKKKSFDSITERPEEGLVYTYFKKGIEAEKEQEEKGAESIDDDFNSIEQEYAGRIKVIDVRALEMPQPMVTILSELELLPATNALFVHHKKLPKFLLPELKNRGYRFVSNRKDDLNIDFIFYKKE